MKKVGIDGCKYGWIAACYDDEQVLLFKDITQLMIHYANGYTLLIDIPIGLASKKCKPRTCEKDARKALPTGKKSSIFPVPCREALHAGSYCEANTVNKLILGSGLSIQSWGIMPKIKEVDDMLIHNPLIRPHVKESHPEIAFQFLNRGIPLRYTKKSAEGINERLTILNMHDARSENLYNKALVNFRRKQVAKDDILDAMCLALMQQVINLLPDNYSLSCYASKPPYDEEGIEMAIYYGVER